MSQHRRGVTTAVAMQKGGVGKTTTTIHLARGASLAGLRALVIDLDAQANTTSALCAVLPEAGEVSIADVMHPGAGGNVPLSDVVVASHWEGVDVAPSIGDPLSSAEDALTAKAMGREKQLRKALRPVRPDYDLILIDTPPNNRISTLNALVAADKVLCVVNADQFSLDGLGDFRRTVQDVQEENTALQWAGILVNKWSDNNEKEESYREIVENFTEGEIWSYRVRDWTGVSSSHARGVPIDKWPGARFRVLAQQYKTWAQELAGWPETENEE